VGEIKTNREVVEIWRKKRELVSNGKEELFIVELIIFDKDLRNSSTSPLPR
jgi:hypothetical protein